VRDKCAAGARRARAAVGARGARAAPSAQLDYEHRIAAAQSAVDLAEQRRRPGWMLDVSYGFRSGEEMDGESRADMLSAMVSVDLPLFRGNRQDREVAAARAEARACKKCTTTTSAK